jgi:hypothetical protein
VKTADGKITDEFKKDPYGAAYRFSEGIAALPAVDWSSPTVGAGARRQGAAAEHDPCRPERWRVLGAAAGRGLGARRAARQRRSAPVQGDPPDAGLALPADIYKETISDKPIADALTGMVRTYDPQKLNVGMSALDQAYRADPIAFKQAFGDGTLNRLQDWQARKDYLPPDQMAEYFKRADDPSFATARKQSAVRRRRQIERPDARQGRQRTRQRGRPLGAVRQPGRAGRSARRRTRWSPNTTSLFKDRYVGTGDIDKAKAQTVERLKTCGARPRSTAR